MRTTDLASTATSRAKSGVARRRPGAAVSFPARACALRCWPEGQDPDDLAAPRARQRSRGDISGARVADLIWSREVEAAVLPRRAARRAGEAHQ